MSTDLVPPSEPAAWSDRVLPVAAAGTFLVAMVVASLTGNPTIDTVASTYEHGLEKVDEAAVHATQLRVTFLAIVVLLLCIGPIVRPLRNLVRGRGAVLTEVGYRFVCVGSCFAAVGNAYAPLVVGSTEGLDRQTMAQFVTANETSWVSYGLLAFYALLPVGALLLMVGLLRAAVLPGWQVVVLGLALAAIMPAPAGNATLVLAVVFAVLFGLLLPVALRTTTGRGAPDLTATPAGR